MTGQLKERAWLDAPTTRKLINAFDQAGKEMRFVGGCVRDAVLGRLVKDMDIATSALPEEVMHLLADAGIKSVPTGLSHGTVTAVVDGKPFEITTLRKDTACDGRHAQVEFTDDWRQDAARRDFTMNALYATTKGEIIDYFDGCEDAKAGRILFIGNAEQRITEDYLRILRFFRFYAHYGKTAPDEAGLKACGKLANHMSQLSGERIQHEILRLLAAPNPADALLRMQEVGVLKHLLGFDVELSPQSLLPEIEKITHSRPDALIRLALLLRSAEEKEIRKHMEFVCHRWKLSNAMQKRLQELALPSVKITLDMDEKSLKRIIRKLNKNVFFDLLMLHWAEQGSEFEKAAEKYAHFANEFEPPSFPVTGADLLSLGIPSGPEIGKRLAALEAEWEENDYKQDKAALLETITAKR